MKTMCEIMDKPNVDLTQTDAYHLAYEEFNNDIIRCVEDFFEADWNDIPEDKREKAARTVEETIRVVAYFDDKVLEDIKEAQDKANEKPDYDAIRRGKW